MRINLWLMNGTPPAEGQDAELILNSCTTCTQPSNQAVNHLTVFPNPVQNKCIIGFSSNGSGITEISIFDLDRRLIRNIFHVKLPVGPQMIECDGKSAAGNNTTPGLYIVRFRDQEKIICSEIVKE